VSILSLWFRPRRPVVAPPEPQRHRQTTPRPARPARAVPTAAQALAELHADVTAIRAIADRARAEARQIWSEAGQRVAQLEARADYLDDRAAGITALLAERNTPAPAAEQVVDEPVTVRPARSAVAYSIPAPSDVDERATSEAGTAERRRRGYGPFVGDEDTAERIPAGATR
jgi:hypothetical protein